MGGEVIRFPLVSFAPLSYVKREKSHRQMHATPTEGKNVWKFSLNEITDCDF